MIRRTVGSTARTVLPIVLLAASSIGLSAIATSPAQATTDTATLAGEGGTFLQPVVTKLVGDASPNFGGLYGSYVATGLGTGIADFIGSGPGQFNADFAVSERALTSTELATAKANGRSFAYVPFAATPVAIGTLVPDSSYHGETDISSSQLCPHISMTVADLGAVFGYDAASPAATWADPRFSCSNSLTLGSIGVTLAANDDPSMANYALMSLLDSDPTAKGYFTAGLTNAFTHNSATTEDTTPSETWPYAGPYVIAGGDDPFLGKLLTINASNNVPSNEAANWVLGAVFPVSSVWTGAPLGAPWNIPTAAVQNAQGSFVAPSTGSATASEKDATLAATSDPTTNNLVTFNAAATDASAYNSYLMEESYLVVPTSGETAAKDTALAALIRYVLGPKGQTDIQGFGAAPATSAMDAAGLLVANQLDAQAAAGASGTTTTTSATKSSNASGTSSADSAAALASTTGASGAGTDSSGGGSTGSGSNLAFTGSSAIAPSVLAGALLVFAGTYLRRRLRRRGAGS
jgi:ABC-type phosphate transport system substrate-binding protein